VARLLFGLLVSLLQEVPAAMRLEMWLMTVPQIFVLVVLIVPLALVFMGRLREDIAALVMAGSLGLAQFFGMGVLGPAHSPDDASMALTGFGTPEVITLLSLFILTFCLFVLINMV
jgi:hypothetical protein